MHDPINLYQYFKDYPDGPSCYICKNAICWTEYGTHLFDCKVLEEASRDRNEVLLDKLTEGIDEEDHEYADICEYYKEVSKEANYG